MDFWNIRNVFKDTLDGLEITSVLYCLLFKNLKPKGIFLPQYKT